ncbi:hypothetical protein CEXT_188981 [Caerostris extrusa]|uniref:Uncharacterized protein n=1 Tax=Caerostris extrusa TaxID=172846 RepID=A0AAV4NN94_CAEEX|nr:hypothetical protein CEXT_188981 [Caerostris extrusa]
MRVSDDVPTTIWCGGKCYVIVNIRSFAFQSRFEWVSPVIRSPDAVISLGSMHSERFPEIQFFFNFVTTGLIISPCTILLFSPKVELTTLFATYSNGDENKVIDSTFGKTKKS